MNCLACGGWSEDDRATGYCADGLCPDCIADGWHEGDGVIWRDIWRDHSGATPDTLRVICAWCGAHLRGDRDAPGISHGICPRCRENEEDAIPF